MRISKIEITDYSSVASATVDFDALPSLVMIAGRVRSSGASSNGAGKSTIIDAMCWCLFGEELRKRPKGNVVRKGQPSCHVTVTVKLDDGTVLVVERHRKRSGATEVVIDGKRSSTASGGQEDLERRIGFNFDLFTRTVVFGGSLSSFCRMIPSERTRLLEELLGVGHYLAASDTARDKLREAEESLSKLRERHALRRERLALLHGDCLGLLSEAAGHDMRQLSELDRLRGDGARITQQIESVSYRLGVARRGTADALEAHKKLVREWRERIAEVEKELHQVHKELVTARSAQATAEAEEKIANRELKNATERDRARVCPTCKRPFDAHQPPVDLTPFTSKLTQLGRILVKRNDVVSEVEAKMSGVRSRLAVLRDGEPTAPTTTKETDSLHSRLSELEGEWAATAKHVEHILEDDATVGIRASADRLWKKYKKLREKGDAASARRKQLARDVEVYAFWQHGFGRDGIPSMILESTAPALNKNVKPLADILTDGAYSIEFNTVRTGQKTDFRVDVSNVDGGASYADLSKGELVRVDLCVLFGIRQLMMDRAAVKCDQVFIDELLDGLDEQGMEYASRLLRSQHIAKQTVYISHADALKDAADGVITVVKKNGISRIKS